LGSYCCLINLFIHLKLIIMKRKIFTMSALLFSIGLFAFASIGKAQGNPIVIEAKDFDNKSEAIVNDGTHLSGIKPWEWVSFKAVTIAEAGNYTIEYEVASVDGGGTFQLEQAGTSNVLGTATIPTTGTVDTWQMVSHVVALPAGEIALAVKGTGDNWAAWSLRKISIAKEDDDNGTDQIVIEAKDFDNKSGAIVDAETHLSGIKPWEWVSFNAVTIPEAGSYKVEYEVASVVGGGAFQLEQAGTANVLGSVTVPATGAVDTWEMVSHIVSLPQGEIALAVKGIGDNWEEWSLRKITITREEDENGRDYILIEAENFSNKDADVVNEGTYVSNISAWRWLSYDNISIPQAGSYLVEYRVSSVLGGGQLNLEQGGTNNVYGSVQIPATGDDDEWEIISHVVVLPAGVLNFGVKGMESDNVWNLDWFRFSLESATSVPNQVNTRTLELSVFPIPAQSGDIKIEFSVNSPANVSLAVYDISGRMVNEIVQARLGSGHHTYELSKELKSGIYFARLIVADQQKVVRFIVK
jgi:hypothetical protein